jgi:hypothetical protein
VHGPLSLGCGITRGPLKTVGAFWVSVVPSLGIFAALWNWISPTRLGSGLNNEFFLLSQTLVLTTSLSLQPQPTGLSATKNSPFERATLKGTPS